MEYAKLFNVVYQFFLIFSCFPSSEQIRNEWKIVFQQIYILFYLFFKFNFHLLQKKVFLIAVNWKFSQCKR